MKTQVNKRVLGATVVAAGLSLYAGSVQAVNVTAFKFNPDGIAGGDPTINNVSVFDWAPGNVLSEDGVAAVLNFVANGFKPGSDPTGLGLKTTFNTYYQAKISALFNSSNTNVTPTGIDNGTYEYTAVAGFEEDVVFVSPAPPGTPGNFAQFKATGNKIGVPNFFEIYYDNVNATDANDLTGMGFNDLGQGSQALMLRGTINPDLIASTIFAVTGGGPGNPLDGFNVDNYPATDSINGTGSTQLNIDLLLANDPSHVINTAFFTTAPDTLIFSIFNTTNNLNFTQVDPSGKFVFASGGDTFAVGDPGDAVAAGAGVGAASLGDINGLSGPDIQFQADASQSFTLLQGVVPEPVTATLSMISVLGLVGSLFSRRK